MVNDSILDVKRIREDFPILRRRINNKRPVYLDSTATTQKPRAVIDAIVNYYENYNANVHRGIYRLSEEATDLYEKSRKNIGNFIGAREDSIVFVRNTTEALNLIAYSYGNLLREGDEILTTIMEHHSNIVPWQFLSRKGVKLVFADINPDGTLNMDDFIGKINKRTRIVTVTHVSNVLGTINDVEEIGKIAHDQGAVFIVDGAQSVPHMPVDVRRINADFLAFSGHKMLGPMGIGVLYGRKDILESMDPFMGGGEMISEVHTYGSKWAEVPLKFEAGTPNVEGAVGLSAAVDYLRSLGMDNVRGHEKYLVSYALERLGSIEDIQIYGPKDPEKRGGVISFNFRNIRSERIHEQLRKEGIMIHPHDVATILDMDSVMVRSGHHCAQPLMERLDVPATSRASFYIYNDRDDVDALYDAIGKVRGVLRI
ncbi:MAG: cysteine desulfurase [Aciduliprofundum sp.]|jgi:cysteine desulfurase/selenocysteine lyase|nr:cysteine desulfurase [Thermoplasmatales archaeon]PMP75472.1 MAG: cysteine desulfurase [Aciduliprofundum sp.]